MSENTVPFSEIVADLRRLTAAAATGAVFIATSDNRSAQLAFDHGKIIYLYYAGRLGVSALADMALIKSGSYRFQPGSTALPRLELPDTETILAALEGGEDLAEQTREVKGSAEASGREGQTAITEAQRAVLQSCLADFVGPIAELLCEDHLGSATDLETAIDLLAKELASNAIAQQFRSKVRSRLG